ncbi:MAG TPA: hypothetical protein DCS93_09735 [Microscillaceae bacterium]|nr:hypothetical protein [Microscillaceae bacterium]
MKIYLCILLAIVPIFLFAETPPQKLTSVQRKYLRKQRKQQRKVKRLKRFLNSKRGEKLLKKVVRQHPRLQESPHKWDRLLGILILSPVVTYYALAGTGLPLINILGIALLAGLVVYGIILLFGLLLPYIGTRK